MSNSINNSKSRVSFLDNIEQLYVFQPRRLKRIELLEKIEYSIINNLEELKNLIRDIKTNRKVKVLIPEDMEIIKLYSLGLVEFEDFLNELYVNKELVVIYGNCHTTIIAQYLMNCNEFNKKYYLYNIEPIHMIKDISYFSLPIFNYCDIFIHQSIQKNNRYGEEYSSEKIISRLSKDCLIVSIPNVYRLPVCFFPQYSKENEFKRRGGGGLFFRDSVLDSMAEKSYSYSRALKEYKNKEYFKEEKLNNLLNDFFEKIADREKDWDIKCLEFIKNNYQIYQLFYDPNHPTNFFLLYVTKKLLEYLKVEFNKEDLENCEVDRLNAFEMPIMPEVKKYFGMEFEEPKELRKNSNNKVQLKKMTFNDYILQYLACEWQNPNVNTLYQYIQHFKWYMMKLYNLVVFHSKIFMKNIKKIKKM